MNERNLQQGLKPRLLILGFGRLARAFYALFDSRYEIRGIKRNPSPDDPDSVQGMVIQSEGLIPLLKWSDAVVFSPSSGGGDLDKYKATYLENIRYVIERIQSKSIPIQKFILIGSTGVYPRKTEGVWSEEALIPLESPRQEILIETEKALIQSGLDFAVLRCGGIYGEGRGNFGRILNAGKIMSSGMTDQFYPLINQEDICGVIHRVIETGRGGIYNVVDDTGMSRRELFSWLSGEAGIPIEDDGEAPVLPPRPIPNTRLLKELGYSFRSPRVTDFLKDRFPGKS